MDEDCCDVSGLVATNSLWNHMKNYSVSEWDQFVVSLCVSYSIQMRRMVDVVEDFETKHLVHRRVVVSWV